jgi:hypothetical protein
VARWDPPPAFHEAEDLADRTVDQAEESEAVEEAAVGRDRCPEAAAAEGCPLPARGWGSLGSPRPASTTPPSR